MGFTYPPIINDSQLYNPLFYPSLSADGYLTYDFAQTLYLSKNDYRLSYLSGVVVGQATAGSAIVVGNDLGLSGIGALACTSLTVGGSAVSSPPAYVLSITEGLAAASKALVLDGSRNITNINALTATTLYGTIGTAAQPNITALSSLTSLTVSSSNSTTNSSLARDYALKVINPINTNGNQVGLVFGITATDPSLYTGGASIVHARTDINSVGKLLFNVKTSTTATDPLIEAFRVNADATSTFNYSMTINGNLTFSGASRTITGLDTLSATTLNGAIGTASQTNITAVGTLTNLTLSTAGTGLNLPSMKFWDATTSTYKTLNQDYYIDVIEGGCVARKALVVDLNKDLSSIRNLSCTGTFGASLSVSTPSLTCDTITKSGAITISPTTLNLNPTTLQLRGTAITATATELNYVDVATAGAGEASKALILDSGSSITSGVVSFKATDLISGESTKCYVPAGTTYTSASKIDSFNLALVNPSSTVGVGAGISFLIESGSETLTCPSANIVVRRVAGTYATSDMLFQTRSGSTQGGTLSTRLSITQGGLIGINTESPQVMLDLGTAVIDKKISLYNGGSGTSTDAFYGFGANSSSVLYYSGSTLHTWYASSTLGTRGTERMRLSDDRLGVGTNAPSAGLHVASSASLSMTGPLATGTSSAYTVNRSGTFTDTVGIYCEQALMVGVRGMYVGSDRRTKENISTIPPVDGVKFVRDIDPKIYDLKGLSKRQVGYISQDMMQDYSVLVSLLPDQNMVVEQEGDVDGAFLSLSYERVSAFLHAALKSVLDRLDEQQQQIDELRAIISE